MHYSNNHGLITVLVVDVSDSENLEYILSLIKQLIK